MFYLCSSSRYLLRGLGLLCLGFTWLFLFISISDKLQIRVFTSTRLWFVFQYLQKCHIYIKHPLDGSKANLSHLSAALCCLAFALHGDRTTKPVRSNGTSIPLMVDFPILMLIGLYLCCLQPWAKQSLTPCSDKRRERAKEKHDQVVLDRTCVCVCESRRRVTVNATVTLISCEASQQLKDLTDETLAVFGQCRLLMSWIAQVLALALAAAVASADVTAARDQAGTLALSNYSLLSKEAHSRRASLI